MRQCTGYPFVTDIAPMEARSVLRCERLCFDSAFAGCDSVAREQRRERGASFYLAVWGLLSPRKAARHHQSSASLVNRFDSVFTVPRLQCCRAVESVRCHDDRLSKVRSRLDYFDAEANESIAFNFGRARSDGGGERRGPPEAPGAYKPVEGDPAESLPFGFQQALQAVPSFGPVQYDGCDAPESERRKELATIASLFAAAGLFELVAALALAAPPGVSHATAPALPSMTSLTRCVPAVLPIMPLGAVKFPTDAVALQLFEPRYRYTPGLTPDLRYLEDIPDRALFRQCAVKAPERGASLLQNLVRGLDPLQSHVSREG